MEYLENWVPKLGLLCEKKDRLGLLGSAFFAGILIGMMIVPHLADKYGRKIVFNTTIFLSIVAQVGLILSLSLDRSAIYMLILGFCFPGKSVVGLNYLLEFIPEKK